MFDGDGVEAGCGDGLEVVVEAVADVGDLVGLVAADRDEFGEECLVGFGDASAGRRPLSCAVAGLAARSSAKTGPARRASSAAEGRLTREKTSHGRLRLEAEARTSAIGKVRTRDGTFSGIDAAGGISPVANERIEHDADQVERSLGQHDGKIAQP